MPKIIFQNIIIRKANIQPFITNQVLIKIKPFILLIRTILISLKKDNINYINTKKKKNL